jgi:hypothetical protein
MAMENAICLENVNVTTLMRENSAINAKNIIMAIQYVHVGTFVLISPY